MKLSKIQTEILNAPERKVIVMSSAASGKAQPNDTLIPTPSGYKKIGDLKVGDKVFNRFGKTETVMGVFPQGLQQVYKVTFADGRETECCGEHLWSYDNSRNGFTTKTTEEMYNIGCARKDNRGHNSYRFRVPTLKQSVDYSTRILPIDPYTLGCFIGDGCCLESQLTISSNDEFIVNTIATINGFSYKRNSIANYSWNFSRGDEKVYTKTFFNQYKEQLCCYCGQKSIPQEYLLGDTEQRMELLRGLMDTDGYTGNGKNSPSFSTTSLSLAKDVLELTRSLGFYSTLYISNREEKKSTEYTVNIFTGPDKAYTIFKLPRKVERALSFKDRPCRTNHNFVTIRKIEKTSEYKEMTCILVDHSEHLYLTNNFIVTHNTKMMTEKTRQILRTGVDPKEVAVITFTNMAAAELRQRLGEDYKDGLFIGTIHSLANSMLCRAGIDTSGAIQNEKFDELFAMVRKNPQCVKHLEWILLDEAQDTDIHQFYFLLEMINPVNFFIVGDIKQSIYGWRGARPEILQKLAHTPGIKVYDLNENYRNGYNILRFAKRLILPNGLEDTSVAMSVSNGSVMETEFSTGFIVQKLQESGDYGNWAVLTRTNAEIEQISYYLSKANIPYDTFKQGDLSKDELIKKMEQNTVKVLTVHSAKGLEWDNVIVVGMRYRAGEERNICYVAATRARENLIWMNYPSKKNKRPVKKSAVEVFEW